MYTKQRDAHIIDYADQPGLIYATKHSKYKWLYNVTYVVQSLQFINTFSSRKVQL